MLHNKYKDIEHIYVVHRVTGFSVTGQDDREEHEVVFTTDDWNEAKRVGRELFPEDPKYPGWTSPSFTINVNEATTTAKGKHILAKIKAKHEADMAEIKKDQEENPDQWKTTQIGGFTFHFKKHDAFGS